MKTHMSNYEPLPIIVGITGHRDIPSEAVAGLEEHVEQQLLQIQELYPHSPLVVLSSLAEGADRLCARAALKLDCQLCVPLPMALDEYEKDFVGASLQEFSELLSKADSVFAVDVEETILENNPPRGYFYRQAGLYIAKHAHILVALWDGGEVLHPEGGGTFETVNFMRKENGIIRHVPVPRLSNPVIMPSAVDISMPKDKRLFAIEAFNREVIKHKSKLDSIAAGSKSHIMDADTEKNLNSNLTKLLNSFLYADAISMRYRNFKLLTLRLLSALGLLLVLAFLLYDEMESDLMLFIYGAVIIAASIIYVISLRYGFHEKYISNRALAEALRVQFYWNLGGVAENVCDHYTNIQRIDLDFVRFIIRSIDTQCNDVSSKCKVDRDCVYRLWVQGQYAYHSASAVKKAKQDHHNVSAAKFMLILSILLFVAVVVMELWFKAKAQEALTFGNTWRDFLLMHEGQAVIWRGMLKIALGAVSAGTAFLANYYGSLALPQQIFDNQRMCSLFESALHANSVDDAGFYETLRMVGRESLIESAAWYVMQQNNTQKLFIG